MKTLSNFFIIFLSGGAATFLFKVYWYFAFLNWPSVPLRAVCEELVGPFDITVPFLGAVLDRLLALEFDAVLLALAALTFLFWLRSCHAQIAREPTRTPG